MCVAQEGAFRPVAQHDIEQIARPQSRACSGRPRPSHEGLVHCDSAELALIGPQADPELSGGQQTRRRPGASGDTPSRVAYWNRLASLPQGRPVRPLTGSRKCTEAGNTVKHSESEPSESNCSAVLVRKSSLMSGSRRHVKSFRARWMRSELRSCGDLDGEASLIVARRVLGVAYGGFALLLPLI